MGGSLFGAAALQGTRLHSIKNILCGAVLAALLLQPLLRGQDGDAPTPLHFPTISAYNLAKTKITLPRQLAGKHDLLVLSFDPAQGPEVQQWVAAAQTLAYTQQDFHYYVLPVVGHENQLFRWWENSSMRTSYSDPSLWPWVVPLYVDKKSFQKALQIADEHAVVILLTNQQGDVLWRTSGPPDAGKQAALAAQAQH
jgi:hypothetical protein